jgi:YHS domain-containing protein
MALGAAPGTVPDTVPVVAGSTGAAVCAGGAVSFVAVPEQATVNVTASAAKTVAQITSATFLNPDVMPVLDDADGDERAGCVDVTSRNCTSGCTIGGVEGLMDKVKDPVCNMMIDPAKAAATSEYNGKTYYFCAKVCKTKFDANPSNYVK